MFDYWIHAEHHDFEVHNSFGGKEEIWCGTSASRKNKVWGRESWCGTRVSRKTNVWGVATDHEFDLTEGDQVVHYVVRNAGPLGYVLRRDGKVVQRRDRPWMRLLIAFGLASLIAGFLANVIVVTIINLQLTDPLLLRWITFLPWTRLGGGKGWSMTISPF